MVCRINAYFQVNPLSSTIWQLTASGLILKHMHGPLPQEGIALFVNKTEFHFEELIVFVLDPWKWISKTLVFFV